MPNRFDVLQYVMQRSAVAPLAEVEDPLRVDARRVGVDKYVDLRDVGHN